MRECAADALAVLFGNAFGAGGGVPPGLDGGFHLADEFCCFVGFYEKPAALGEQVFGIGEAAPRLRACIAQRANAPVLRIEPLSPGQPALFAAQASFPFEQAGSGR